MYLAPQNIPRAISVLTVGNEVIFYCIVRRDQNENRLKINRPDFKSLRDDDALLTDLNQDDSTVWQRPLPARSKYPSSSSVVA